MTMLKRKHIGAKEFTQPLITATDPCYDDDTWCRKDGIAIKPGVYDCSIYIDTDNDRVMILQIRRKGSLRIPDDTAKWECIGNIGVDSALAGFFQDKPNYKDDEWSNVCDFVFDNDKETEAWIVGTRTSVLKCDGFFSKSGYGDGCYDIFGIKNTKNEYVCLELRFS